MSCLAIAGCRSGVPSDEELGVSLEKQLVREGCLVLIGFDKYDGKLSADGTRYTAFVNAILNESADCSWQLTGYSGERTNFKALKIPGGTSTSHHVDLSMAIDKSENGWISYRYEILRLEEMK